MEPKPARLVLAIAAHVLLLHQAAVMVSAIRSMKTAQLAQPTAELAMTHAAYQRTPARARELVTAMARTSTIPMVAVLVRATVSTIAKTNNI
jgi:hypothetical protein